MIETTYKKDNKKMDTPFKKIQNLETTYINNTKIFMKNIQKIYPKDRNNI